MFLTIKKFSLVLIVCLIFLSAVFSFFITKSVTPVYCAPNLGIKIVIDAGHGGMDGGGIGGNTGVKESDLNLSVALKLEHYLKSVGIDVVQTRKTKDSLNKSKTHFNKKEDMQVRREIIEKESPDMVISIHMNDFPLRSQRGAQVFYQYGDEESKKLAGFMQAQFIENLIKPRGFPLEADYYMLKCTERPSVIVECGYLSNPEEELLLQKEDYQENVAYFTFCGIMRYIGA